MYFNHYSKKGFWDDYYTPDKLISHDWLQDYKNLKDLLGIVLPLEDCKTDKVILDVGCGTSTFLEFMYQEGYNVLVGIDFCESIVQFMKEKYTSLNAGFECKLSSLCYGCY